MDRKKINLNLKLSDLKLTEERKQKISGLLLHNLRLLFLIFLGTVTIYSFNIIFRKAYVEINYVEYPSYTNVLVDSKGRAMLEKIMQNVEDRKNNITALESKRYADPFSFRDSPSAVKTDTTVTIDTDGTSSVQTDAEDKQESIPSVPVSKVPKPELP